MPHVKGNKFKPKPDPASLAAQDAAAAEAVAAEAAANAAAAKAAGGSTDGNGGDGKRSSKKKKSKKTGQQNDAAAPPAAAPAAAEAAEAGSDRPAKKKRKLGTQQQQAQEQPTPAIPTVVAPAPRGKLAVGAAAVAATSNWAALKATLDASKAAAAAGGGKPHWKRQRKGDAAAADAGAEPAVPEGKRPGAMGSNTGVTKVLALDCEMVGVGPGGEASALARVCVVNSAGHVLLDTHVRPRERVTDYRTKVSGVRPSDLKGAPPFSEVQARVEALLKGRVLVGHALTNDLQALLLSHPRKDLRDTSRYPPFMSVQGRTGNQKPRSLRQLTSEHLGLQIQEGEHSPVDDARAALYLYLKHRKDWERWVQQGGGTKRGVPVPGAGVGTLTSARQIAKTFEELAKRDTMADL